MPGKTSRAHSINEDTKSSRKAGLGALPVFYISDDGLSSRCRSGSALTPRFHSF